MVLISLPGCYTARVEHVETVEEIVEERLGEYLVALPVDPTPEQPLVLVRVANFPHQTVRTGRRHRIHRQRHDGRLLALGALLQWVSYGVASREHGIWTPLAVGINLAGFAGLVAGGGRRGYLSWLVPRTLVREATRYSEPTDRIPELPNPVPRAEVLVRAGARQQTRRTDASGQAWFDLVGDLGLETFDSDRAVSLDIIVPVAEYQRVHHLLPREFLYPYYDFGRRGFYANRSRTGNPVGYTSPDSLYRVAERYRDGGHGIGVVDGPIFYVNAASARLVRYASASTPAVLARESTQTRLLIRSLKFVDRGGDGLLNAGERGAIHLVVMNPCAGTAHGVEVTVHPRSLDGIRFGARQVLGDIAPGREIHVHVPLRASLDVGGRQVRLQIRVTGTSGPSAVTQEITFGIRGRL